MNLSMKKTKETDVFVFYKFSGETSVDAAGAELPEPKRAFGICKFSKADGSFELVGETDPIFLTPRNADMQKIKMQLLDMKLANDEFPEKMETADF